MEFSNLEKEWVSAVLEECCNHLDLLDAIMCSENAADVQSTDEQLADNLRSKTSQVLHQTLAEICRLGTFETLTNTLQQISEKQNCIAEHIQMLDKASETASHLDREVREIRAEAHRQLDELEQACDEKEAYVEGLRPTLEDRVRKEVERRKEHVRQFQERTAFREQELQHQVKVLKEKTEWEIRINQEVEMLLQKCQEERADRLAVAQDKCRTETIATEERIAKLEEEKISNLYNLEELHKRIAGYEEVIAEDKREKEMARKLEEAEKQETNAVLMVQSWWRGTMVRRSLGPNTRRTKAGRRRVTKSKSGQSS